MTNDPERARKTLTETRHIPVAVFHPAYEDEVSRRFWKLTPQANAARERAKEAHFLTDQEPLRHLSAQWNIQPSRYR